MAEIKDGGPAFPTQYRLGMSLRDYFAAAAVAQMLPWAYDEKMHNEEWHKKYVGNIARTSYAIADAMLAEREKK